MFKGTFDALAHGEVVALFPEGTSYTEPRIMQVKDGASWAALEYTKWATSEEGKRRNAKPLSLIPAGLVYTNKSKYRSSAIMEYVYGLGMTRNHRIDRSPLFQVWQGNPTGRSCCPIQHRRHQRRKASCQEANQDD